MEFGSPLLLVKLKAVAAIASALFSPLPTESVPSPPPPSIHIIDGFEGPYGLTVLPEGTLYVADALRGHVVRFSPSFERTGIIGSSASSEFPHAIARGADGTLFIPDHRNGWIQRYDADGDPLGKFTIHDADPDIQFVGPVHVLTDEGGTIFVTDYTAHRVLKFSRTGKFLGWIGERAEGTMTQGWAMTGKARESSSPGGFTQPHMVALDRDGNLYIADTGNHRIQKFSPDGTFLGMTGGVQGKASGGWLKTGPTIRGRDLGYFDRPTSVTFAKGKTTTEDYLIIADTENERLQRLGMDGKATGWMGGVEGGGITGGWHIPGHARIGAEIGAFHNPFSAQLLEGKLYVADTGNKRVQIILLKGK